jgi:hypothetical protein
VTFYININLIQERKKNLRKEWSFGIVQIFLIFKN